MNGWMMNMLFMYENVDDSDFFIVKENNKCTMRSEGS